jgi:SpoVK/Ycf46/Vps4 family AAA+-type ATPase
MAPVICMIDEMEKALSGVGSVGDSGVSTRLFGTLLTYLSDHESDVFFVATSNDISRLPPELSRAERFDGVFFLDLPSSAEKDQIWALYRRQFAIPDSQARPDDTSWTGAEIHSCCRLTALLDVPLTQGTARRAGGGRLASPCLPDHPSFQPVRHSRRIRHGSVDPDRVVVDDLATSGVA